MSLLKFEVLSPHMIMEKTGGGALCACVGLILVFRWRLQPPSSPNMSTRGHFVLAVISYPPPEKNASEPAKKRFTSPFKKKKKNSKEKKKKKKHTA